MQFLIIQKASATDLILSTCVIKSIMRNDTNAEIDLIVKSEYKELLDNIESVKNIYEWKGNQTLRNILYIKRSLSEKKYDYIINLNKGNFSRLLNYCIKAKNKLRPSRTTKKDHEIDRLLSSLYSVRFAPVRELLLLPNKSNEALISRYTNKSFICIAPGAVPFTKQYPFENWIEFIIKHETDKNIYLLGSTDDWDVCELIVCETDANRVFNFAGKLNYLESTALISKAAKLYTNESVFMHMASAVNTKTIGIYCSSIPDTGFTPLAEDSIIIETSELLTCRPCSNSGKKKCPKEHFKCAHTINNNQLLLHAY